MSSNIIFIKRFANLDPQDDGNLDPDPHYSVKLDPDLHLKSNQALQRLGAMEGRGLSQLRHRGSTPTKRPVTERPVSKRPDSHIFVEGQDPLGNRWFRGDAPCL